MNELVKIMDSDYIVYRKIIEKYRVSHGATI